MRIYLLSILIISTSIVFSQEDNKEKPKLEREKVVETLKKLSSENYEEREKASEELKKLGLEVAPLLEEELKNENYEPEAIWRMEKILSELRFLDFEYRNKKLQEKLQTTFNGSHSSHSIGSTLNYVFIQILGKKKINYIAAQEAGNTRASISYKGSDKVVDVLNSISKEHDLKYEIINGMLVIASEEDLKKYKERLKKLEEKPLPEGFKALENLPFSTSGDRYYYDQYIWKNAGINVIHKNREFYDISFSVSEKIPFKSAFYSFLAMFDCDFEYNKKKDTIVIKKNKE